MESELYKLRTDLRADNFADSGGIRHIVVSDVLLNGRDVRKRLAIPSETWQVAAAFDGKSTPDQIRERVKAWYWREISPETIEQIAKTLDQHYLLNNDRYRNHLEEITADLGRTEVRQAYPDPWSAGMNAEELTAAVDAAFRSHLGPGAVKSNTPGNDAAPAGVIVPHATYRISGPCAAHAYAEIASASDYDLFVIFGYNHIYSEGRTETLLKDIATPLGTTAVDREFGNRLLAAAPDLLEEGGAANYFEHSIDVQIPMLQCVMRQASRNAKILPIILSNVPRGRHVDKAMGFRRVLTRFGTIIRQVIRESGKRVCLIASGDFAHCGPYYGDGPVTDAMADEVRRFDQQAIRMLLDGRKDEFYLTSLDARLTKYCCVTPVFLLLSTLGDTVTGRLLRYYTTRDIGEEMADLNSFASIAYYN